MRHALALAAVMVAFAAASAPVRADEGQADGPLGPAREGKGQCYSPDAAAKTCRSIAWYRWDDKGFITNRAEVALNATDAALVMTNETSVAVKDGAVCGPIRVEDLVEATFTVNGQPAEAAVTDHLRQAVASAWASRDRSLICTTYTPDGDGFRAEPTVNGVARADLSEHVIWIAKDDGWRVAR
jgi:hypothetical protein